ncbi:hypothetical protein P692DRAFT_20831724 [Suillus brevipes Sb2]|nr:hypothetical protein P692DRAFT_20831724 [Suillus brevipes Sb2]
MGARKRLQRDSVTCGDSCSNNSHTTSSEEVCEVAPPSLLAEEEIVLLKRSPSLPTEDSAPIKCRRASQRVQRGK